MPFIWRHIMPHVKYTWAYFIRKDDFYLVVGWMVETIGWHKSRMMYIQTIHAIQGCTWPLGGIG